jgi:hypothetical protein
MIVSDLPPLDEQRGVLRRSSFEVGYDVRHRIDVARVRLVVDVVELPEALRSVLDSCGDLWAADESEEALDVRGV